MKLLLTERFRRDYRHLPAAIQDEVDEKLGHPSLQVKKMQGTAGIWELRVTQGYRLTFQIERGSYLLRKVGSHDILRRP